jgi:hypothetical protein
MACMALDECYDGDDWEMEMKTTVERKETRTTLRNVHGGRLAVSSNT